MKKSRGSTAAKAGPDHARVDKLVDGLGLRRAFDKFSQDVIEAFQLVERERRVLDGNLPASTEPWPTMTAKPGR